MGVLVDRPLVGDIIVARSVAARILEGGRFLIRTDFRRCSSVVERTLGKGEVTGSNPISGYNRACGRPLQVSARHAMGGVELGRVLARVRRVAGPVASPRIFAGRVCFFDL